MSSDSKSNKSASQPRFLSLRIRLMVAFTLVFSLLLGGSGLLLKSMFTIDALRETEDQLRAALEETAGRIDAGNLAGLLIDHTPASENIYSDPRYVELLGELRSTKERSEFANPYILIKDPANRAYLEVVNLEKIEDPELKFDFLSPISSEILDEVIAVGFEQISFYLNDAGILEEYPDKTDLDSFGLTSGFIPLITQDGQTAAVLGIDFTGDHIQNKLEDVRGMVLPVFGLIYVGGLTFTFITTSIFLSPFPFLTKTAKAISKGDYDHDLSKYYQVRVGWEISDLARAIEDSGMAHKREQKLIKGVKQLEIYIDSQKREEEVQLITDSEFFANLKSKVKEIHNPENSREPV